MFETQFFFYICNFHMILSNDLTKWALNKHEKNVILKLFETQKNVCTIPYLRT